MDTKTAIVTGASNGIGVALAPAYQSRHRRGHAHPALRFGGQFEYSSALPLLDGVYLKRDRAAVFHEAAAPSTDELETVLLKIITRTMRILTRLGAVIEEPDRTYLAETDTDGALRALQAALCNYRVALGPRAEQKVLSLRSLPSAARPSAPELRVNAHGFSLHAAVRWRADQRAELEHLCRYITLPAIANEGSNATAPVKSCCN